MFPSGGWDLLGVGQKDGEREANLITEGGTWTSSMEIGWKFAGSYGVGEIISGVKTRVLDSLGGGSRGGEFKGTTS